MAETISEFAKSHMKRTGWVEGKGLGRNEDGMSEAIKVKIKADTAGIGHDPGEQFTFHWWEHAFQKSAQNIKITEKEHGVEVETKTETEKASTRKRNQKLMKKKLLYGNFVKSGTLENGKVQKSNSDASSDDDESGLEMKNSKKPKMLTDEELLAACGGRTAHKGARHGVNLIGKLARLEEQELVTTENVITEKRKAKKKKKIKRNVEMNEVDKNEKDKNSNKRKIESNGVDACDNKKSKKKRSKESESKDMNIKSKTNDSRNKSKKKKKKKSKSEPER